MTVRILDKKSPDVIIVPFFKNEALTQHLSDIGTRIGMDVATLIADFNASSGEVLPLYAFNIPGRKIYLLGLGEKQTYEGVLNGMRSFFFRQIDKLPEKTGIDLRHFPEERLPLFVEAMVCGARLSIYKPAGGKASIPPPRFGGPKSELDILSETGRKDLLEAAAEKGLILAEARIRVMEMVDAPANIKTPQGLTSMALRMAEEAGFTAKVMDKKMLQQEGMHALLAVGQGSPHPPCMLLLHYGIKTRKTHTHTLGLVGKGVTFDTGGVSLKPSANMQYMKSDMGGAAAVLGVFYAVARLKLPVRLVGAVPIAENMIDGNAIKPGDVINTYSGKTVEVLDTDAEGRLILADALNHLVKKEKPEVLIDLATLTGSVIRTLGYAAAGLFTQNDALAGQLYDAGQHTGEKLWRLPLWAEYGADLHSDVATLRNFTGKPMAEAISAAKFLENFTEEHPAWAHLDIAGKAFGDSEFTKSKSATGFGVKLLVEFLERNLLP